MSQKYGTLPVKYEQMATLIMYEHGTTLVLDDCDLKGNA